MYNASSSDELEGIESLPVQVKAVLCAALFPNCAAMDDSPGKLAKPEWHDGSTSVCIHPSSINSTLDAQQFLRPFLVYLEKVLT